MTDSNAEAQRKKIAATFNRSLDPLDKYTDRMGDLEQHGVNPFEVFRGLVLENREISEKTLSEYDRTYRQWQEFMHEQGRHPACPNEDHVRSFYLYMHEERGNAANTLEHKHMHLNAAYNYWCLDNAFPHGNESSDSQATEATSGEEWNGFNPFTLAWEKLNLEKPTDKEPPRIAISKLRDILDGVTHIRNRPIIALGLKLGLRATEVCNIELSEVSIENETLREHYPRLGTDPRLEGHENALYIPPNPNTDAPADGRQGNKSKRPRILPLDEEIRHVLLRWLLIRPTGTRGPWLFVSKTTYNQLNKRDINEDIWKPHFWPEYEETEFNDAVTSHFGRHYFTTYWKHQGISEELIAYMRGDKEAKKSIENATAMRTYIHTYYEDIEPVYRDQIFNLGLL